jgi:energy-coupling factor transport system permease protein
MNFELYGDDSKGIVKLDPRTKLLVFLSSGIMTLNTYSNLAILVYSLTICLLLALCGKPWGALKAAGLFGVMLYIRTVVSLVKGASPAVSILFSALSTIFLFCFPMIVSFLLLIQTTRISQFLSAFQAMHLPVKAMIPVAMLFRFIPTVQEEWNGIRKAMAFRGISLSPAFILRHPGKAVEYILVPLLFSSVNVMEELAAAALARGMDVDVERSSFEEVKLHAVDWFVMAVFVGMIIFVLFTAEKAKRGVL